MSQWMEVLVPGLAGPPVVTMMETAPVPVCVGPEPAITPPLSVEASRATGSVLKLPTAPGTYIFFPLIISNYSSLAIIYK